MIETQSRKGYEFDSEIETILKEKEKTNPSDSLYSKTESQQMKARITFPQIDVESHKLKEFQLLY